MFVFDASGSTKSPVQVGSELTIEQLEDVARRKRPVSLADAARSAMSAAHRAIFAIAEGGDDSPHVYGVNTGFGFLSETRIDAENIRLLQRNLIRSHACAVGPRLSAAEVRGMMLLRAQVLALGHSGVRIELVELLLEMLNRGVHPHIYAQGSVGASGDLAPLAHLALVLMGEGTAEVNGEDMPGLDALKQVGLTPLTLEAKEGLALINGTQYMAALGSLALLEAERLCTLADIAGAMSLEANKGSSRPFDERIMKLRRHPGQALCAENLRKLLADSPLMESHANCSRVQDAYSFRCMPQVHGASRDGLTYARQVLEREINAVTDNPLVFLTETGEADLISGGNFHGQPLAFALDMAAMCLAELANVSERRVEQLVNPALSSGLTPFLAKDSGLHSGMMIAQVTAASLVSENKVYCHPASVDSIPSSAGKEDHVSMGSISARKLLMVLANVRKVLAIEALVAAAGLDQRKPLVPSKGVRAALSEVRSCVPEHDDDRPLHLDMAKVEELFQIGALTKQCESAVGTLALAHSEAAAQAFTGEPRHLARLLRVRSC